MLHRNSRRTKEGEIFRRILQTFFTLSREEHATVFLLTLMSAILRVVNHSAKKKKRNIWNMYSGFEVKINCTRQNYLTFA